MLEKAYGTVVRMGKDKTEVDVHLSTGIVTVKNMIPDLKVGDTVWIFSGMVIQKYNEKQAEKMFRH